mgnify:CR=1 FL=1
MAFLLSVMALLSAGHLPLAAQGWERIYGGNSEDYGEVIIPTSDWGFLMVGYSESFANGFDQDFDIYVVKTDVDGEIVWQRTYDPAFHEIGKAALELDNGHFLIAADVSSQSNAGPFSLMLLEINADGMMQDSVSFSIEGIPSLRANDMVATPDGGLLIVGAADYLQAKDDDILLLKISPSRTLEWHKVIDSGVGEQANAVARAGDDYVLTGRVRGEIPPPDGFGSDIVTYRVDNTGEVIWERKIITEYDEAGNDILVDDEGNIVITGFTNQGPDLITWKYDGGGEALNSEWFNFFGKGNVGESIIESPEGGYVIAGYTELNDSNVNQLILGLDKELNLLWSNDNGDVNTTDIALEVARAKSGGYVMTGWSGSSGLFVTHMTLMKTDNQGQISSNFIRGQVFHDLDIACDLDPGEPRLKGWIVRATGEEETYYSVTDEQGRYRIRVDSGSYLVEALPRNDYWESCFLGGVNIGFNQIYDTVSLDFPLKANYIDCPLMEVDVSTPFLSNCTDIDYTVHYANEGTGDTNGEARVEVELDPSLTFESASLPFTFEGGQYVFELGNVPYNSEGSFVINTSMACDNIIEGQSALVTARIYPDTLCSPADPGWNGASVSVAGLCENNENVSFRLANTGDAAMAAVKNYFIVEEDLMFLSDGFDLDQDQDTVINLPANGATYRIIAEQVDGHPGNNFPTIAVEGCGTDEEGGYSTGYVAQWPENDGDAAVSIHADEILEAVPDVALVAHPKGWQDSIITAETELTYRVYFRNITQDSVVRVVVRDTLPGALDISTVTFGASSHPATFDIYDTGVVKATFENLVLPQESTGASSEDYAYFEYRVAQKPDNPVGTVIENNALVIYDYAVPVYTEPTRHVVDAPDYDELLDVIPVDIEEPEWAAGVEVVAFPNPATEFVTLQVRGLQGQHELTFTLMNLNGQPVRYLKKNNHQCTFSRANMPAGSYIYQVRADGQPIAAGTLIIR